MRKLLIFSVLLLVSCSDTAVREELTTAQKELATAQAKITKLEAQIESEGDLVHIVLFQLKPDADKEKLIEEVRKLEAIEVVKDLEVGEFKELGDARALSQHLIAMQMSFDDEAAYQIYQKHPIHLTLKDNTKTFMAGPPVTYDFIKE